MRVGQARKRDANEQAIVHALRAAGAIIFPLSGKGVPDLLVHFRGKWTPLEVKVRKGTLTPEQQIACALAPFRVVRSVEEALLAIGCTVR